MTSDRYLLADWPAPNNVVALTTTRCCGVSKTPFNAANFGDHVGDSHVAVEHNRSELINDLGVSAVSWLEQVHGNRVVSASAKQKQTADAVFTTQTDLACAVLSADCLPVLLCDRRGTVVAAAHCGWRSLCADILPASVNAMQCPESDLIAWLGPAIGPTVFEVGSDVVEAFRQTSWFDASAFRRIPQRGGGRLAPQKYVADIFALARASLRSAGVDAVYGGGYCTVHQADKFYSFRRDGITGRMASLIFLKQ